MVSSTRGSFSNFRLGNSGLREQGAPVLVQLQRPEVALGSSKTRSAPRAAFLHLPVHIGLLLTRSRILILVYCTSQNCLLMATG